MVSHSKTAQFNCVKNCTKNWTVCSLAQHKCPISFSSVFFCQFCVSSCACDYCGQKQGCGLLLANHIGHDVTRKKKIKRKVWSKKWYFKRNISCDALMLRELLETDVEDCLEMMPSWCQQVNWGNCGIPWVTCTFLCVKDDWKGQFEACTIACQNCAFY
jgi:hypothetical protein